MADYASLRAPRILLVLCAAASDARAAEPHRSFWQLPVGNGRGIAVWDAATRKAVALHEHTYRSRTAGETTRDVLYDAYFGVRAGETHVWLNEVAGESEYVEGDPVVVTPQEVGAVRAQTHVFVPWEMEPAGFAAILRVEAAADATVDVYFLSNLHLGSGAPEPDARGEEITWDLGREAWVERGAAGVAGIFPLVAPSRRGASPENPWESLNRGDDLADNDGSGGARDDAVAGLQWSLGAMRAGDVAWVGVVVAFAADGDYEAMATDVDAVAAGPEALLGRERAAWAAWLGDDTDPVDRLALAVLRMAQVREGTGAGQIVASLPPGQWNIAWVRDMAYATVALARAGKVAEARAALEFVLGADNAGEYPEYVGEPYQVSITRYSGDGTEETDFDENGPNVELDGFGLFLWSARAYVEESDDGAWLAAWFPFLAGDVADVLARRVDETGLVQPDSSIWEVHWNGRQKRFAYTSIAAARGLCDAASLALRAGDGARAETYRAAAAALAETIETRLLAPDGSIGASLEDVEAGSGWRDAATVEAVGLGVVAPDSDVALASIAALDALVVPSGQGWQRNDDGGWYDEQEWVFVDLRAARAAALAGHADVSETVRAWVRRQAEENYGLLAELFDRKTADYAGATPMAGFGAGAWLLGRETVEEDRSCFRGGGGDDAGPREPEDAGADAGRESRRAGCGCRAADAPGGIGWLLVPAIALLRRRLLLALLPLVGGCLAEDFPSTTTYYRPAGSGDGGGVESCEVALRHEPAGATPAGVWVAGEWNAWSDAATPMADDDGDGVWEATLDLAPGRYGYKLVVDGVWTVDAANPYTIWQGGFENSLLRVPDCARPRLFVESREATADGRLGAVVRYEDGVLGAGARRDSARVVLDGAEIDPGFDGERFGIALDGIAAGKHTLRFEVSDAGGRAAEPLYLPQWIEDEPFDWNDALVYFAFTDRFRNGDPANDAPVEAVEAPANYQGGDLQGVRAAIEDGWFEALGVRALWLSPVAENTDLAQPGSDGRLYTGYHGYWPSAPRDVEARFGGMEALREVVAAAHRRGIRVLLDLVSNHVHVDHPYWREHRDDGWFHGDGSCTCGGPGCDWDSHRIDCWFTSYLPDLDYANDDVVQTLTEDALFWVREADVDGLRVDAVKHFLHVAGRTLAARLAEEWEQGGVRYYLVGETFTGTDGRALIREFLGPNELDGQFDFPLYWPVVSVLAQGLGSMRDLEAAVRANDGAYPEGTVMSPFLGNHDVPRFLSYAAGQIAGDPREQGWSAPPPDPADDLPYDRLALGLAFVLTAPGAPLLYYGDEVGIAGAGDPDNRRFLPAEADLSARQRALLATARAIGTARRETSALRSTQIRTVFVDDDVFVYARGSSGDVALVGLNRSGAERAVTASVPATLGVVDGTTFSDRLGGPDATVSGGEIDLVLPPVGAAILTR